MLLDESSLIQAMQAGEANAFRQAVSRYSAGMLATAHAMVQSADADDAVQEAWVSAVTAIGRFEGRSSLQTWLNTIVANRIRDKWRRQKSEVVGFDDTLLSESLSKRFNEHGHWQQPTRPWHADSIDSLMETEALRGCIDHHIQKLPDPQRSVLVLGDMQNFSMHELCNILDMSASNVRVSLHRARQALFSMIEHFQETGQC